MNLFDDNEKAVSKTKIGLKFSQAFDKYPKRTEVNQGYAIKDVIPFQIDVVAFEPIVLENYFEITNAGKYHLKFVMNSLLGDGHSVGPFYLPVEADIEIKKP